MAARYVCFNVNELVKVAVNAVRARSCVSITKFADGMFNKAFQLIMDDGKEVVAKIPNLNAGPLRLTTASEVATMDFMRNVLKIPVPNVYTWCNNAEDSAVGAEYIIMEKANGVSLDSVWPKLGLKDRFEIIKQITEFQTKWSAASYEGYGSIYYTADTPEEHRLILAEYCGKFALGPIVGRDWNDDGRQSVVFDRGPWRTLEAYLEAIGRREITCINTLEKLPSARLTLCGPGLYLPTREKKISALKYYLQFCNQIAPSDVDIRKPSAWHGDLHIENIFVDPSEPTKISSIFDWQSTKVAPLFMQTRQPFILDHSGSQANGLDPPSLPSHFEKLTPAEKNAANRLLIDQSLCVAFRIWTKVRNPVIWKPLEFQSTPAFQLLNFARNRLVEGEAFYMARVIEQVDSETGVLRNSRLLIPDAVKAEVSIDSEAALSRMGAMSEIEATIGDLFPERGCVKVERYDEAKNALHPCKEQIIDRFATSQVERGGWEKWWPFDNWYPESNGRQGS